MNALQELVQRRLNELDISLREAVRRSHGMLSLGTLSRMHSGQHTGRLEDRTIGGLCLVLRVSEDEVRKAADETLREAQAEVATIHLPERFRDLPEPLRKQVVAFADYLLSQHRGGHNSES